MKVKNRLSPYPILFDYRDDYIESSFKADISVLKRFHDVVIDASFHLSDETIQSLIDRKQAKFLLHVECPALSLRRQYETADRQIQVLLDMDEIAEKLEICTFIVVSGEIAAYTNPNFHPDYHGLSFHLCKGQLLAIGPNKIYSAEKDGDAMESLPSIIKITKADSKTKGTVSVNTDDKDHIFVGLNEDAYDLYARLGRYAYAKTVLSLVLLPALMVVLDRVREAPDAYQEARWYGVIEDLLAQNGYSMEQLTLDDGDNSVLSIAQAIFANPVQKSLRELDASAEGVF